MNPDYFGDSYDLVKRFFCNELSSLGYTVLIDPMFTGDWAGTEQQFFKLIGAVPVSSDAPNGRTALLVDPDTGVHGKAGGRHVSIGELATFAKSHEIVAAFDQSFSRQATYPAALYTKLSELRDLGVYGMYYNSHARFVFAAVSEEPIAALYAHLVQLGLPSSRLVRESSKLSFQRTVSGDR
ncbi:MAG: hypothetical protein Q7T39_14300 [Polaromonas sp.]|nr:hypothetical protein [Polaromonas sp.]